MEKMENGNQIRKRVISVKGNEEHDRHAEKKHFKGFTMNVQFPLL